jgi:hypothetical protein
MSLRNRGQQSCDIRYTHLQLERLPKSGAGTLCSQLKGQNTEGCQERLEGEVH